LSAIATHEGRSRRRHDATLTGFGTPEHQTARLLFEPRLALQRIRKNWPTLSEAETIFRSWLK